MEMAVPPGNRRGSDLRRTCSVRRKVRDPRTAGFRLGKRARRRRQGGLWGKAHLEPLPSFAEREASRILYAPSLQRQASFDTINAATMRLCRIDLPAVAHSGRSGWFVHNAGCGDHGPQLWGQDRCTHGRREPELAGGSRLQAARSSVLVVPEGGVEPP